MRLVMRRWSIDVIRVAWMELELCSHGRSWKWMVPLQMWVVQPEFEGNGRWTLSIHLDCVVRAAHLLPIYGSSLLLDDFHFADSLDLFHAYFVNSYIDHHNNTFLQYQMNTIIFVYLFRTCILVWPVTLMDTCWPVGQVKRVEKCLKFWEFFVVLLMNIIWSGCPKMAMLCCSCTDWLFITSKCAKLEKCTKKPYSYFQFNAENSFSFFEHHATWKPNWVCWRSLNSKPNSCAFNSSQTRHSIIFCGHPWIPMLLHRININIGCTYW
jgi:hypothetical protein